VGAKKCQDAKWHHRSERRDTAPVPLIREQDSIGSAVYRSNLIHVFVSTVEFEIGFIAEHSMIYF
jgi:hypothetical protein